MPHRHSKSTQIILLAPLRGRGKVGDIISVKNGYARNYLLPKQVAVRANEANRKLFEQRRDELQRRAARERAIAVEGARRLAGLTIAIHAQASPTGRLYGAISARQIVQAAAAHGVVLAPEAVFLREPIRTVGRHSVQILLHADVDTAIDVLVGNPGDDFASLLHDGATLEERHHLAFELLDQLAIDCSVQNADATADLVRIVSLADTQLGMQARDALRNDASGPFEQIVRTALGQLDVDCLFSLSANVDERDDGLIHFRARLCAALPARVGNASFIRLVDGCRAEASNLELSLFSPVAQPVSEAQRHLVFAGDDEVGRVEMVQSLKRMPSKVPSLLTEVWASAHLNGSCVHRRVWSIP